MVESLLYGACGIGHVLAGPWLQNPVVKARRKIQPQTLFAESEIDLHDEAFILLKAVASYTQFLKLKAFTGWSWEALCLLVYLTLAWTQLFVRPIVGMANNGDFPKVLASHHVCDTCRPVEMAYVHARYVIDPECYWDSTLPSSESIFASVNTWSAALRGRNNFSITGAGKAHLVFMLAALAILLWALHGASPWYRFGLPPLVILIFSDVLYVSYLNSFYMDAASMVFLLPTVALSAAWVLRPRTWVAIAFGVAGLLLGLSKTQHFMTPVFLAGLAAWFARQAFRQGARRHGWYWSTSATAVALAAAATVGMTPGGYKAEPLYSLIFCRILPELPSPVQALAELGLPESDVAYSGTHADSSNAAIASLEWRIDFNQRVTYTRLAGYYLRNPSVTLHLIWRGLTEDVPGMRPGGFGNYLREDGFPPGTQAQSFGWWSHARSWISWVFPVHIVIFYCLMGVGSFLCFSSRTWAARWPQYPLVAALAACGAVEFLFALLLDGTEMARHLFLFHVITETLIVSAVAAILSTFGNRVDSN